MRKHKAMVRQTKKTLFKKKRPEPEISVKRLFKDSISDMNILGSQAPTIYLCGNESMYIEHYENILEYTGVHIRIQLEKKEMVLDGKDLILEFFSPHDLKVRGHIDKIMFASTPDGR